jgi:hypothetical protein
MAPAGRMPSVIGIKSNGTTVREAELLPPITIEHALTSLRRPRGAVVITGASSGIGRATALALAAARPDTRPARAPVGCRPRRHTPNLAGGPPSRPTSTAFPTWSMRLDWRPPRPARRAFPENFTPDAH